MPVSSVVLHAGGATVTLPGYLYRVGLQLAVFVGLAVLVYWGLAVASRRTGVGTDRGAS